MIWSEKLDTNEGTHRIWFKNIFNPILRAVQFWTDRPYVIVSKVEECKVIGYGFRRMRLLRK